MKTPRHLLKQPVVLILLLCTTLSLDSCRRDNVRTITIKGRVLDRFTQVPIYHASVAFKQGYKGETRFYPAVPADSNGYFTLVCEDAVVDAYGVVQVFDSHSNIPYQFHLLMQDQETIDYSPPVPNPSSLTYRFINAAPFDIYDSVSDFYIERPWGSQYLYSAGAITTATPVHEQSRSTSYYGCPVNVLHYTVTKNGIAQSFTDTFRVTHVYANWKYNDTIWY